MNVICLHVLVRICMLRRIDTRMLEHNRSLEYLYVCKDGCFLWDGGVAGRRRRRRRGVQGKMEGKERVPQACPGSDGSPDNLLCNGLPRSLTAVKLQAGALQLRTRRRQTAF